MEQQILKQRAARTAQGEGCSGATVGCQSWGLSLLGLSRSLCTTLPLNTACRQVDTILCLVQTPGLCSAKSHTALQRGRGCFPENQMAENVHSTPMHCHKRVSHMSTSPLQPPKGQWCLQTDGARVPIRKDISTAGLFVLCQYTLEKFKSNLDLEKMKCYKLQWHNWG